MKNLYLIGGEHKSAIFFAALYFALGLLFGDLKVSVIILIFFAIAIVLERLNFEMPLAILIRIAHIIFIALIILSVIKAI